MIIPNVTKCREIFSEIHFKSVVKDLLKLRNESNVLNIQGT